MVDDNPMLGIWQNLTDGDTVSLTLVENRNCQLSMELAYQNSVEKACRYEPIEGHFVIFLVKADGGCGSNLDFEFGYDAQAPLVQLYVQGSPMILNRLDPVSL